MTSKTARRERIALVIDLREIDHAIHDINRALACPDLTNKFRDRCRQDRDILTAEYKDLLSTS